MNFDEDLRFVVVKASNPREFTRRAMTDPNVRYVERAPVESGVTSSG